jgi:hypothetical protein
MFASSMQKNTFFVAKGTRRVEGEELGPLLLFTPLWAQGKRGSGTRAGIFKKSMGARHRVGIGLLYRPARLHRLAEFIPWNPFRGPIHVQKYQLRMAY